MITADELEKLAEFKKKGIISEEEFNSIREEYLKKDSINSSNIDFSKLNFSKLKIIGLCCLLVFGWVLFQKNNTSTYNKPEKTISRQTKGKYASQKTRDACIREKDAQKNMLWLQCLDANVNPSYLSAYQKMEGMKSCQYLMDHLYDSCYDSDVIRIRM